LISYVLSFLLVAFGQNAWVPPFAPIAALCGYALFWQSTLPFSQRLRFWGALIWFASVQGIQTSWMTTTDYMGPLILLVYVGLLFCLGVQFGLLTILIRPPFSLSRCAAFSGIWVLMEWIRLFPCSGFTWNPVGLSLTTLNLSLQAASLFGIFGLSFWVMFVNLIALRAKERQTHSALYTFLGCALIPYLFGAMHQQQRLSDSRTLSALLIQTALLPEEREYFYGRPDRMIPPVQQWERIFEQIGYDQPDLIVLPEGALPFKASQEIYPQSVFRQFFPESSISVPYVSTLGLLQALADEMESEIIVGLDDHNPPVNAAFHLIPHQTMIQRTEKRVLMPIAEYIPLKGILARFILETFGIEGSFQPGSEPRIFSGSVPIGVSICYEETFSEMTRVLCRKGAKLLVTISNDVWFPHSRLAQQHFDHGIIRAVENGVPLLRSSNTGVTGAVDCFGRVLAIAPLDQLCALSVELPLYTAFTFYSYWGDAAILILSTLFALILAGNRSGRYPCSKVFKK
jgi:apolipoprotein N-acyltransferase